MFLKSRLVVLWYMLNWVLAQIIPVKLVARVKNEAKQIATATNKEYIIVDGSPGIGCPVVSSISGANFVVLVTEPSVSGLHDLKRVYELVKKFKIKAGCIINKADINNKISGEIEKVSKNRKHCSYF